MTLLLLLVVPLRVYAAVAMVFCGQTSDEMHDIQAPAAVIQAHASMAMTVQAHDHQDGGPMDHDRHHDHAASGADVHEHLSCGGCCCAGMIATAQYDWKPQSFAAPATPPFVSIAVPRTVAHRLERPPRDALK